MLRALQVPDRVRDCVHPWLTMPRSSSRMAFHTYVLSCNSNTAIYIGVTGNLQQRAGQHRSGKGGVHTAKYRIRKLVYFETHDTLGEAIARERKLKRWPRAWGWAPCSRVAHETGKGA